MKCIDFNLKEPCRFCLTNRGSQCWIDWFKDIIKRDTRNKNKNVKQTLIKLIDEHINKSGYRDGSDRITLFLKLAVKTSFPQYEQILENILLLQ
jgi:hypothetical protein